MELIELKERIIEAYNGDKSSLHEVLKMVEQDTAVFPFNEYELLITTFISKGELSYDHYLEIREEYKANNPNLWVFEISAPRGFGETFAQTFLLNMCKKLKPASKKLDPESPGQYDLWLDGIRIEVKASRVVDSESSEPLYRKALSVNTKRPFLMNFQQLKPQCCDVFIWVAVYRDFITVWVMNSEEVQRDGYSKGQHRGNHGNEGQFHITQDNIGRLDPYKLVDDNLELAIRRAFERLNKK